MTTKTVFHSLIGIMVVSLLMAGPVFGYNQTDCPLVELYYNEDGTIRKEDNGWNALLNSSSEEIQNIIKNEKTAPFPEDNLIKAIDNLRGYCCGKKYLKADKEICKQGLDFKDPKRPDSRFLYDHLITIGFQRLDSIYGQDIVPIEEDQAKEWREKITETATTADGAIPVGIVNDYNEFWYNAEDFNIVHIDKTQNISQGITDISGKPRAEMGLASKYYTTCYVAMFLNPSVGANGSKKSNYEICKRLANTRIAQEVSFVQTTSIEQGARMLATNANNYLNEYFTQQALMRSIDKRGNLSTLFKYIATKTQGVHSCSM